MFACIACVQPTFLATSNAVRFLLMGADAACRGLPAPTLVVAGAKAVAVPARAAAVTPATASTLLVMFSIQVCGR
jgi:hypothetical protein